MKSQLTLRRIARCGLSAGLFVAMSCPLLRAADAVDGTGERLLDGIKYLASDELQGRGVGTDGLNRAAEYVRDEFEKAGLDMTRVEGQAFQTFKMTSRSELGTPNRIQFRSSDGQVFDLEYDKEFRTCGFGSSSPFNGEIVFCGYAIEDEKLKYNDFDGIDLKGKVALVLRRVPQQANPHGPFSGPHGGISHHGGLTSKVKNVRDAGAIAMLLINDPYTVRKNEAVDKKLVDKAAGRVLEAAESLVAVDPTNGSELRTSRDKLAAATDQLQSARDEQKASDVDPLIELDYLGRTKKNSIPVVHLKQAAGDRLLAALKTNVVDLEASIDSDLKPRSAVLKGWSVDGETSVKRIRAEVKNVIGVLEGEGPLADETIVIGAHYDHVGMGGEGSLLPGSKDVHNGADDNASGALALIELARRLTIRGAKLPRRLVFIAFTAEELGLLGSAHYVKQPLFPIENTIAMFNMDMVGRLKDEKLTIFGVGTAPRWKGMLETLGQDHGFQLTLKPDGFGPSDQSSFYAKKIPVLHFFTGSHSDYHRPSDDWQKINVDGIERVIAALEQVVVATAEQAKPPKYLKVARSAGTRRGGSRPYFGSIPDFGSEVEGYAISGVSPDSPADKGGLSGGDAIIKIGKSTVTGLDDFDLALRKLSPGDEVDVVVLRKGKKVNLKVTLSKPR